MSKRAASYNDQPNAKRARLEGASPSSALSDPGAWLILEQFLTTPITYGDTEIAFAAHLGERLCLEDWKEARLALFSGDGDDALSLSNLLEVKRKYIPDLSSSTIASSSTSAAAPTRPRSRRPKNAFVDIEAEEDEDEQEEEEEEEEDDLELEIPVGPSRRATVTQLPAPKHKFSAAVDKLQHKYTNDAPRSSETYVQNRMYLFHVYRTVTQFVADHLEKQGFSVRVSPWSPGQLYIVSDSPKTILQSLPHSHSSCVTKWDRISDQESESVDRANLKLPDPCWVRIKLGKYKGDIAYVFDPEQTNNFVQVLIPPRDFPYPMPKGSVALFDRSRIPANSSTDIIRRGIVVGWSYKGEEYYGGLLKKNFHRYMIELIYVPHPDAIRLHLQSGFDVSFVKKAETTYSLQMLRAGDSVRLTRGEFPSEIGTVLAVDHQSGGTLTIELKLDGVSTKIESRLQDVERVFWVGDEVKVVAGVYLGIQGHIVSKMGDMYDVCQHGTNELVQVSQYYLDRRPLQHSLQGQVLSSQPLPEHESIEIGDFVEVLVGQDFGKSGTVEWVSPGGVIVWFRHSILSVTPQDDFMPPLIEAPASSIQRTRLPATIKFTKERGYDVRPGDSVSVVRGPDYMTTGVVQRVDFVKARLLVLSEDDQSIVDVPIGFAMKIRNASIDTFKKLIGQEVYIIGGHKKGYRATLYDVRDDSCTVSVHGEPRMSAKLYDVATSYAMRLNGAVLEYHDLLSFCETRKKSFVTPGPRSVTPPPECIAPSVGLPTPSIPTPSSSSWTSWSAGAAFTHSQNDIPLAGPSSSTPNPWVVNAEDTQDTIDAAILKLSEKPGPSSWLKEFGPALFNYHALFKVSVGFQGGKLSQRLAYSHCPDPFCGPNGPAPENCIAAWATAKTAGGAVQHYHIPSSDLSPALPRRKKQECLVLEGDHRGAIHTVTKCNAKLKTVELSLMAGTNLTITVPVAHVCLVEPFRVK
ncbi:hypothetical protein DEU56DRAFT_756334 [Suillus clintonianus]|uniref:uncharacterized protein n=1 Tax=Suillus clintonianus TaxID=1904413 RepID=UPI001B874873|nr:uncharacterized protein DEU56DRAFT_756334 [Suillus clintonianus]KAG2136428.1 hypothetical protein DEU56DRAFT_756334 [Suillus clintonianus]